jgi:putative transcriptional regulator
MNAGFLFAGKKPLAATGTVIADAKMDEDVGVARLNGIIEHKEGMIHVCKVPRILHGGSKKIRRDKLLEIISTAGVVAAVGLEAYIALQKAGKKPDMFFGAREGVIEAAFHGIDCAIVVVDEEFTDFLKRLESVELAYAIHDLISP